MSPSRAAPGPGALLALLGLGALAVGTLLAFPRPWQGEQPRPGLRAVLVDLSAGTTRRRPTHGLWVRQLLREEALAARARGEELAVTLVAEDARLLGVEPAEAWLERLEGRGGRSLQLALPGEAGLGSELDRGLGLLAEELLDPARPSARLLLAAALDHSGPDPRPRLRRLAGAGVEVAWATPPPAALPDLALESIELPRAPEPGAPLAARLDLAWAGGDLAPETTEGEWAEVVARVEAGGEVRELRRALARPGVAVDPDGYRRWSLQLELGKVTPGHTRVSARVRLLAGGRPDPLPENDQGSAHALAGELRQVGIVCAPARRAELSSWLLQVRGAWPGLELRLLDRAELGPKLAQLDLLISVDLAPRDLPQERLEDFVRGGGSWLFSAGWRSLGGWLPDAAAGGPEPLAALLPLTPASDAGDPRDVVFLVDGSGSMEGEPFRAVQAALAILVVAVPAGDALRLQFFTGSLTGGVDLRVEQGGAEAALRRLFDARVPGGPTAILYSLEQFERQRRAEVRPCLTFLLTDGKDETAHDPRARAQAVRDGLSRGESRLVVIAAGAEPDRRNLERFLGEDQTLIEAEDLGELAEFFQREVFRGRAREGELAAALPAVDAAAQGSEETRALLAAWSARGGDLPPHRRSLRCRLAPGAEALLVSAEEGEPWIAWRREGRGRVAAWSSSVLSDWAPAWRGAVELLGPLLRSLARGSEDSRRPRLEARAGELLLSGELDGWPATLEAQVVAAVGLADPSRPLGERVLGRVELAPASPWPGADPRAFRAGRLPTDLGRRAAGRPLWVRLLPSDGRGEPLAVAALDLACSPELAPGGQRRQPRPRTAPRRARQEGVREGHQAHPGAWRWTLAGLLGLFGAGLLGAARRKSPRLGASPQGPRGRDSGRASQGAGGVVR